MKLDRWRVVVLSFHFSNLNTVPRFKATNHAQYESYNVSLLLLFLLFLHDTV
jgi:hypothetical protein